MAKTSKKQIAWRRKFGRCMKRKTKTARIACLKKKK